jgi:predicted nucleic acid-binding protein
VLVDANVLLYAVDEASPFHERASTWLTSQFNGARRVGSPWQSLVAFIRVSTHEQASANPLTPGQAAGFIEDWLEPEVSWIPREGPGHARILNDLITRYQLGATSSATRIWRRSPSNTALRCAPTTPASRGSARSAGSIRWLQVYAPPPGRRRRFRRRRA